MNNSNTLVVQTKHLVCATFFMEKAPLKIKEKNHLLVILSMIFRINISSPIFYNNFNIVFPILVMTIDFFHVRIE